MDVAYNGSEPVRADTLERFAARLASARLPSQRFLSLLRNGGNHVAGDWRRQGPGFRALCVDAEALQQHRVTRLETPADHSRVLVACGRPWHGAQKCIVNPTSGIECSEGQVGELW